MANKFLSIPCFVEIIKSLIEVRAVILGACISVGCVWLCQSINSFIEAINNSLSGAGKWYLNDASASGGYSA
ncbi:hypothetical protein D3C85_1051760 [compost metagenome]